MAIRHDITLSTTEPNNDIGLLKIRQADEQTQTLVVQLTATSQPKSYEGLQAFFCAKLGQSIGLGIIEQKLEQSEMTNPKNGQLEYTFRPEDWQQIGRQTGYFSFRKMKDDGHEYVEQFTTRDFYFNVTKNVFSEGLTEVKKDGSTYVWTIEDLIRLFNEYIASGKSDWEEFVEQNREVLESVDPGGKILNELIEARSSYTGETYTSLNERIKESEKIVYNIFENPDYINVVQHGIKNDGSVIPENQMDEIVQNNIGKTLFFPAGTYNLSGPIKSFCNPEKQIHFRFDTNAVITTELPLQCLLFVGGFDEITGNDRTQMEIYGGQFKAANCQYGILINRRKMNVTLRSNRIYEAKFANIMFKLISDTTSPHSSTDVNIIDTFISGREDGNDYGIYIPEKSNDTKMSNVRVERCHISIFSDSGGNYLTNCHFMPVGEFDDVQASIGVFFGLKSQGGTLLNCYFDTTGTALRVEREDDVQINSVNCEYYSYLENLKMIFFDIKKFTNMSKLSIVSPKIFLKVSNSYVIKYADVNSGYDYYERIKIRDMQLINQAMRAYDDFSRKMNVIDRYSSAVSLDNVGTFKQRENYATGLLLRSLHNHDIRFYIKNNLVVDVNVVVRGTSDDYGISKISAKTVYSNAVDFDVQINAVKAKLGYVLCVRFIDKDQTNPVISVTDLSQNGNLLILGNPFNPCSPNFFEAVETGTGTEIYRVGQGS